MSFLAKLSFEDLRRLRAAAKRVYMRHYPRSHCTDREADRIIESIGPQVAEKLLKAAVDSGLVDRRGASHG